MTAHLSKSIFKSKVHTLNNEGSFYPAGTEKTAAEWIAYMSELDLSNENYFELVYEAKEEMSYTII